MATDAIPGRGGRLLELAVTDLALIDRLRLGLEPGLNVLTGETGAGKSLLIDALGLALGARADTTLVRHGAEGARVEALFDRLPEPLIAVREVAASGLDHGPDARALLVGRDEGEDQGHVDIHVRSIASGGTILMTDSGTVGMVRVVVALPFTSGAMNGDLR